MACAIFFFVVPWKCHKLKEYLKCIKSQYVSYICNECPKQFVYSILQTNSVQSIPSDTLKSIKFYDPEVYGLLFSFLDTIRNWFGFKKTHCALKNLWLWYQSIVGCIFIQ